MNRHSLASMSVVLILAAIVSGCATDKALQVRGDLSRPESPSPSGGTVARAVAVVDFAYQGPPGGEIGRDFDNVRPIIWKAEPGRQVSDLIARILFEKGIPVVRVRGGEGVPADAAARVWGRIDELRISARRSGTVRIEESAKVSLTVYGAGEGADPAAPFTTMVSSEYSSSDPLFVTSERVLDAVNGAANGAAEEAVRRLTAAGVIPAPRPEAQPPAGAPGQ